MACRANGVRDYRHSVSLRVNRLALAKLLHSQTWYRWFHARMLREHGSSGWEMTVASGLDLEGGLNIADRGRCSVVD